MENQDLLAQLNCAINLTSMMPPSKLKKNLAGLVKIAPQIEESLYQKILVPMRINSDGQKPFLLTELNRDSDNYRSPIDNNYYPNIQEGAYIPSEKFRQFQITANDLFNQYTRLYYGSEGIGSFYVLESDQNPDMFACGYYAKKIIKTQEGLEGEWNSFNTVDIQIKGNSATYKLESKAMIEMNINKQANTNTDLTGFMSANQEQTKSLAGMKPDQIMQFHLVTVGTLIESVETRIRQRMDAIYISKTKNIVGSTRFEKKLQQNQFRLSQQIKEKMMKH